MIYEKIRVINGSAMVIGVGHLEFTDKTIHINEFYEIIIEILFQ